MANEGRCISCGFLGSRDATAAHYPGVFELQQFQRENLALANQSTSVVANAAFASVLACARGVISIPDEIAAVARASPALSAQQATETVLTHDRRCRVWCLYQRDFDPKEHLMEIRQRAFERATKWIGWLQIVVAVIVGVLGTLGTLAALPDNAVVWKILRPQAPATAPAPEKRAPDDLV